MVELDMNLYTRKTELLSYYRSRAEESMGEISRVYGSSQFRQRAAAINQEVQQTRDSLLANIRQKASGEGWSRGELLNNILMLTHCCNAVMLQYRNMVWPYEYMTFSRRIGEVWESFCALCFEYTARRDMRLFVPPLFKDVQKALAQEIRDYIDTLPLSRLQKKGLHRYYERVWSLMTSGEIKLELDVHCQIDDVKYHIDLKSGFGSNEKGNTNRLLLVASIYKNLERENHRCLMLVRQKEDENNHYLITLKTSGLWEIGCGDMAYERMKEMTGFDIGRWIHQHIDWPNDLTRETFQELESRNLSRYLKWS